MKSPDEIPVDVSSQSSYRFDANTFLLRPDHRDFVLGKSKILGRSSRVGIGCIIAFFSVFALFGVGMMVMTLYDTYEWFVINQQGMTTTARYIDRRMSSSDDSDSYYVTYQYSLNSTDYTREQQVAKALYNNAEVGGRVEIVYARSNPQIAAIEGTNNLPLSLLIFSLIWNAFVLIPIWLGIKFYRQYKLLEREGRLVQGEILRVMHSLDSDGDFILKLEYIFQVPGTYQRLSKTESAQRNDLKGQVLPVRGTPVVVLYNHEKHFMLL